MDKFKNGENVEVRLYGDDWGKAIYIGKSTNEFWHIIQYKGCLDEVNDDDIREFKSKGSTEENDDLFKKLTDQIEINALLEKDVAFWKSKFLQIQSIVHFYRSKV